MGSEESEHVFPGAADSCRPKVLILVGLFEGVAKNTGDLKQTVSAVGSLALSTLASRDVVTIASPVLVTGGTLVSTKTVMTVLSPDADDGPFLVGVAAGALSAAQIEAAIENDGPFGPTHMDQMQNASRFRHIRTLGVLQAGLAQAGETMLLWIDQQIKLGFTEADAGWVWWIYNLGATLVAGSTWEITERDFVIFDKD